MKLNKPTPELTLILFSEENGQGQGLVQAGNVSSFGLFLDRQGQSPFSVLHGRTGPKLHRAPERNVHQGAGGDSGLQWPGLILEFNQQRTSMCCCQVTGR